MQNIVYDKETQIAVVDDDVNVRDFLQRFLKMKGYTRVRLFGNGSSALEAIQKEDIKLVLLDIMLPDMNGVDVLRKIKAVKFDVAVIMITGFPDEEKAKETIKEGAYDYIIKPFDLNYLELSVLSKTFLA